jgi:hypothetical protein
MTKVLSFVPLLPPDAPSAANGKNTIAEVDTYLKGRLDEIEHGLDDFAREMGMEDQILGRQRLERMGSLNVRCTDAFAAAVRGASFLSNVKLYGADPAPPPPSP